MVESASPVLEVVRMLLSDVASLVGPEQRGAVDALADRLIGVPTIALAGRVSSGKSTLVNALVGAAVAPTDAGECTRMSTLYECGAPESLVVVGLDGSRTRFDSLQPSDPGLSADRIDFAVAYTPQSRLLTHYRVIDTPGLSSHTVASEKSTRRALLERDGLPLPEVVLFLVEGGHLRSDEVEFLRAMGASRLNTILVVSRADVAGDGPLGDDDPFDVAARNAERIAREHRGLAATVLPVAGIMAESAEVGISEGEAAILGRLVDRDEWDLIAALDGDDEDGLAALQTRIGLYGVVHGRSIARRGAVALSDWLTWRSGLAQLLTAIDERFRRAGPVLKARTVIDAVRHLALTSPARLDILTLVEQAELDPRTHCLREVAALDRLGHGAPTSTLIDDLERLVRAGHTAEGLGLPSGSTPDVVGQRAIERIRYCRTRRAVTFSGVEREALTVLERSYQLMVGGAR